MKTYLKASLLALALVVATLPNAFALTYGSNITIHDGEGTTGVGIGGEDNETEPGMIQSQAWDLEGFFRSGTKLTMIGGFDFKNGVKDSPAFTSGDIFFSTNGGYGAPLTTAGLKDGFNTVKNTYGYEYALSINWSDLSYNAYRLIPGTSTTTVYYNANQSGSATSNPWKVDVSDKTKIVNIGSGFGTGGGLINANVVKEYGLKGKDGDNNHYAVSFDISSIFSDANLYGKNFYTHFTMGCGNDNLIGQDTAPVPEPGTLALLGFGMFGLALYGKRRANKNS